MSALMVSIFFACGDDDDGDTPALIPTITSLTPSSGAVGDEVVIAGTNFGTSPAVRFGTIAATVAGGSTANSITVNVPAGLPAGDVAVTVAAGGQTSAAETFTVTETTDPDPDPDPGSDGMATVTDTVVAREDLSSLETAIGAASGDLATVLAGDGPFTVFAPNNDAFVKLLRDLGVSELSEVDAATLEQVLRAHVVNDSLGAAELTTGPLTTVNDSTLNIIKGEDGAVTVNGATVIAADIQVANGVVHIIDSVVNNSIVVEQPQLPDEANTVVDVVAARDELTSLEAALTATELVTPLNTAGPFTIFAPNDDAFAALLTAQDVADLQGLIDKLGAPAVTDILRAHVVEGKRTSDQILDKQVYSTLDGVTLTVRSEGGKTFINGAEIVTADIEADNGVIHIIDEVVNLSAANDGSNGFTVMIENVSSAQRFFQHGVFNTPVGGTEGVLSNGEAYEFNFQAGRRITGNDARPENNPGQANQTTRLSFVSMYMPSKDWFLGTNPNGVLLYGLDGRAISADGPVDITDQLKVWDAGTKKGDTDEEDLAPVRQVEGTNATDLVTVTVSNVGTEFTVLITNKATNGVTFSPGVFGIHTVPTPIFGTNRSALGDGLKELAEAGDPSVLDATMTRNEGLAVPLSSGVYTINDANTRPFLTTGQAASGALEQLAEDGVNGPLFNAIAVDGGIKAKGRFDDNIAPGESITFDVDNVAEGDYLNIITMMIQSNDVVYTSQEVGIPLFVNGNAFNGNARQYMVAYDAGTEVNEYPGAGPNQPIRGGAATGAAEGGTVQRLNTNGQPEAEGQGGFTYRPVEERIRVTITPK